MRLTNALFKHNMWRVKKFNWQQQSKRRILDTKVKEILVNRNIEVVDANEIAALPKPYVDIKSLNIVGAGPIKPQPGTKEHPTYHEERVRVYKDNNVLLEGIDQAKLLTNTVEPTPKKVLPQQLTNLIGAVSYPNQDQLVKRCINNSLMYDAEQVTLPHRKDPERPAWVFPRDYGISHKRRNFLLSKRLLQLCETISQLSGNRVSEERFIVDDACFSVPLKWNDDKLLFDLRADLLVASKSALSPIAEPQKYNDALPDISPLLPTVSLDETNFYQLKNKFPMKSGPQGLQVHTAIVHYNETEVGNLFESEVLKSQILGRTLMKAYTFAVAQARQNYGPESEGALPVPVTVQTIHTNGQWFHFSVLQLNTFEMNTNSLRNYFWSAPFLNLYSFCGYEEGRPALKSYNPDVFKTLLAFYNNQC